tara:strand:+ start:2015 stop:3652 length:1638 start_codon:yes stop_codon:yes gene_type:complete
MKGLLLAGVLVSVVFHTSIFSQCSENEEDKVLLVGDSWAFFMGVDQTINDVFEQWGHSNKKFFTNLTLAENGAETVDFLSQNKQDEIEQQLMDKPSIDIVHLSIGGNDVLGSWNTTMTSSQTDSIKEQVKDSIIAVIDFIQSVRPGIQVVWSGYCYSNFQEVIEGQLIPSAHPFYGTWEDMNFPDNQTINTLLNEFTDLMYSVYENDPNVHVIKATGMMQHTFGQVDPLEIAPFGSYPSGTAPLSVGFVDYPSPKPSMRNYGVTKDCFHLSVQGYEDLISYHTQKYYHKALMRDKYFIASNDSRSGAVSSNGSTDTLLLLGDNGVENFETIINFDTQGEIDSIIDEASIYIYREQQLGTNPVNSDMVVKIINGSFGQSYSVEIDDFGLDGSYQSNACVFGDNQDGKWVRIDLPGQLLPFISGFKDTQIKLVQENPGSFVRFSGTTDPEFAPVLDIKYGNQSVAQLEENKLNDIAIYPNPANDHLTIKSSSNKIKRLSVYNMLGDYIELPISNGFKNIDLSSLNEGTYLIKIITAQGVVTKKFMKK